MLFGLKVNSTLLFGIIKIHSKQNRGGIFLKIRINKNRKKHKKGFAFCKVCLTLARESVIVCVKLTLHKIRKTPNIQVVTENEKDFFNLNDGNMSRQINRRERKGIGK